MIQADRVRRNNEIDPHTFVCQRRTVISPSEITVLRRFREYLMTPGVLLCFSGPDLDRYRPALRLLSQKKLIVREKFKGAYSLTQSGFDQMKSLETHGQLRRRDAGGRSPA